MTNLDKFCLNWNGYDANIKESFRKLREGQGLFDVTLVTDDGQEIQAHKIILSAGSNFFSDIFIKNNHSNMLVYLKGISRDKVEPVIDFIYTGEVFIAQDKLKVFIETGKDLQIKGLEGEVTGISENMSEMPINPQEKELGHDDHENGKVTTGSTKNTVAKMDEGKSQLRKNNELDLQIDEMIDMIEGVWRCKICGKTTSTNQKIRRHAEIHIEGMSHACHICNKTFTTRNNLTTHIYRNHSRANLL